MKDLSNAALCALVAIALSGCSSGDSSSNSGGFTLPTIVTTETFSGTVDVGGSAFHPFTVGGSGGTLNVTLTAAGPPATIFMGLGVGTPSAATANAAASCPLLANASLATASWNDRAAVGHDRSRQLLRVDLRRRQPDRADQLHGDGLAPVAAGERYSPSALAAAASTCGTRNGFVR